MNVNQLKSQYIEGIYQSNALLIKENAFTLQSGKRSHVYLDHRNFLANHVYLQLIAKLYHELSVVAGMNCTLGVVDSVMSPIIVGAMSVMFNHNYVVIKKSPLAHGTQQFVYGEITNNILLVDDMTSTGDTLIDAAKKIRSLGGSVDHAVISAYRDKSAIENLARHHIKTISIASFDEIIDELRPVINIRERKIIESNSLIFD